MSETIPRVDGPHTAPERLAAVPPPGEPILAPDGGRWVVTPSGERIFVIGAARPAVPSPKLPELRPTTYSEELEEIIGTMPGALVRWGITIIFAVLCMLLALSFVVRFPQVASGRVTVTAAAPPVRVVARTGAPVERLFIRDGQSVREGAILLVLRSAADSRDVLALAARIPALEAALRSPAPVPPELTAPPAALGEVQGSYTRLMQALAELRAYGDGAFYGAKAGELDAREAEHARVREAATTRLQLLREELALADRQRSRALELAARGLLSREEAEQAEGEYLRKAQAVENGRNELASNALRVADIRTQRLELRHQGTAEELARRLAVRTALDGVREAVRAWEDRYLVRAPAAGRTSFFRVLDEGQFVAASEPLIAVVPEGSASAGTLQISSAQAGRVQAGQRVLLRFDAFPAAEFGSVEGRISRVSLLADHGTQPPRAESERADPTYLVHFSLPRGLRTDQGRHLEFRQEMQGTASILTGDQRVIDRLLYQFRELAVR